MYAYSLCNICNILGNLWIASMKKIKQTRGALKDMNTHCENLLWKGAKQSFLLSMLCKETLLTLRYSCGLWVGSDTKLSTAFADSQEYIFIGKTASPAQWDKNLLCLLCCHSFGFLEAVVGTGRARRKYYWVNIQQKSSYWKNTVFEMMAVCLRGRTAVHVLQMAGRALGVWTAWYPALRGDYWKHIYFILWDRNVRGGRKWTAI